MQEHIQNELNDACDHLIAEPITPHIIAQLSSIGSRIISPYAPMYDIEINQELLGTGHIEFTLTKRKPPQIPPGPIELTMSDVSDIIKKHLREKYSGSNPYYITFTSKGRGLDEGYDVSESFEAATVYFK